MTKPTRRRGGPYPHCRLSITVKYQQGFAAFQRIMGGESFRQAAAELGMPLTTCWRRYHWFADRTLPGYYGLPDGPVPPQRGTAACPRGRPWIEALDGPGGPLHRTYL